MLQWPVVSEAHTGSRIYNTITQNNFTDVQITWLLVIFTDYCLTDYIFCFAFSRILYNWNHEICELLKLCVSSFSPY